LVQERSGLAQGYAFSQKTAFSRFSAVHRADLEGQQWVDFVEKL